MCTVTVIGLKRGAPAARLRLVCNRDELRTRPASLPPVLREFGRRRAILPIDPPSGGTWIAVNCAGLALTLLNVNPISGRGSREGKRSRGLIIPALLDCGSVREVADRVEGGAIRAAEFPPFRLVGIDTDRALEVTSAGASLQMARGSIADVPFFFTSSGLGDHLVDQPRRELFEHYFRGREPSILVQDEFHEHQWPDRPHLSVCMSRNDARTVSRTTIEIDPESVSLAVYTPAAPHDGVRRTLPRQSGE
jgi:hypothetical protein